MRQPFSLQKRTNTKGKRIYYVQFWMEEEQKYSTAKSTGQSSKTAARLWAYEYLKEGGVLTKENITLREYAQSFFSPESDFVIIQKSKGKGSGIRHLQNQQSYLKNHINPFLGDKKLKDIDTNTVDSFQVHLIKEKWLSYSTVNHVLLTLKQILQWALRKKMIKKMPMFEVVTSKSKEKGILTPDEVIQLFSLKDWDTRHLCINMLSYTTGMRLGECLGLQRKSVDFENMVIHVTVSYEKEVGLKETKTGEFRIVILNPIVSDLLREIMESSSFKDENDFIFHSTDREKPLTQRAVRNILYKQLEKINIPEPVRKDRDISFHSARHFFNSYLINNGISTFKLQKLTGHSTDAMSLKYFHMDEMNDVRQLIDGLFIKSTKG